MNCVNIYSVFQAIYKIKLYDNEVFHPFFENEVCVATAFVFLNCNLAAKTICNSEKMPI